MLYKVNETFYSIIGEGKYTGYPATFIRLSGCNKKCSFCDTEHNSYVYYDEKYLTAVCKTNPSSVVVITGGEPLKQDLKALVESLYAAQFEIHLETNCTLDIPLDLWSMISWVSVSPKGKTYNKDTLLKANEVKILCGLNGWVNRTKEANEFTKPPCIKYLYPLDGGCKDPNALKKNTAEAIKFIKKNPGWRLGVQIHKVIGVK